MQGKIKFGTREELQESREDEFLKLSGGERLQQFFQMIQESAFLYGDNRKPKNSFVVKRRDAS